jgi:fluoroquinolone resistance protein
MKNNIIFHDSEVFDNLNFTAQKVSGEEFESCTFNNCIFSDSSLNWNRYFDCEFKNCNLSMARFNNCQFRNVQFTDCKLLGVNFSGSTEPLVSLKFVNCIIDFCTFSGKKMQKTIFRNLSAKSVDFAGADLALSSFLNCDLQNSVFNKSNLTGADFSTSFNIIIDPELNSIRNAKFSIDSLPGLLLKYNLEIT